MHSFLSNKMNTKICDKNGTACREDICQGLTGELHKGATFLLCIFLLTKLVPKVAFISGYNFFVGDL